MQCAWHKPWLQTNLQSQFRERPKCQRLYSNSESKRQLHKQELLMADLAQKWLIIKQRKLHSDSPDQAAHCGQLPFLLLGKRSGSPLNSIYIFALCSTKDCQALFGPGVQIFPLVFRTVSWKLPAECMVVPGSHLPKNCGSLQMLWLWKFLLKHLSSVSTAVL